VQPITQRIGTELVLASPAVGQSSGFEARVRLPVEPAGGV
jgi:hypothetical protein